MKSLPRISLFLLRLIEQDGIKYYSATTKVIPQILCLPYIFHHNSVEKYTRIMYEKLRVQERN